MKFEKQKIRIESDENDGVGCKSKLFYDDLLMFETDGYGHKKNINLLSEKLLSSKSEEPGAYHERFIMMYEDRKKE